MAIVSAIFRIRRDTAANWTSVNPVLKLGEPGLETDTRKVKYGDGSTAWTSLAYSAAGTVAWDDITSKPANLTAIAAQATAADKLTYWTGLGTVALADFSAFGRTLVDDADATTARTTLGLGTIATQAANSVAITGGSVTGLTAFSVAAATSFTHSMTLQNAVAWHAKTAAAADTRWAILNALGTFYLGPVDLSLPLIINNGGGTVTTGGRLIIGGSARLPSYTVATVPSAATHGAGAMIYVSNESGGAVPAFSDGAAWRRVTDRAVVS